MQKPKPKKKRGIMIAAEVFSKPSVSGDSPKPADLNGHLLIIKPTEFKTGIQTSLGEADAIQCEIIDLDTNKEHASVLFFNVALKNSLKSNIGKTVLARLGQGVAKPGKSAPWILLDATTNDADIKKATDYLTNAAKAAITSPASFTVSPAATPTVTPEVAALLAQLTAKPV